MKYLELIRLCRNDLGFTLQELSDLSGVPFQRISKLENGRTGPRKGEIEALETALGIDLIKDSSLDQEILSLFDQFINSIFYSDNKLKEIFEKAEDIFYSDKLSKYRHLLPVMIYIYAQIENKRGEVTISKFLYDDPKANALYLAYLANEDPTKEYERSIQMIEEAIRICDDYRIIAIAKYQLCFIHLKNDHNIKALNCIKDVQYIFMEYGSYIRDFQCNHLKAIGFFNLGYYEEAARLLKGCLDSMQYLNIPNDFKEAILRNIAFCSILDNKLDTAFYYLKKAKEVNDRSRLLWLYYVYAYGLLKDEDNIDYWIRQLENHHTCDEYLKELSFWKSYVRNDDKRMLIKKGEKLLNYFKVSLKKDNYTFYSKLIIGLYEELGEYEKAYFLLKENINPKSSFPRKKG